MSRFGLPDFVRRSSSAKAVWKAEYQATGAGSVSLMFTPPADAPVGSYVLSVKHKDEEMLVESLVILFNPWCPGRFIISLPTFYISSEVLYLHIFMWICLHFLTFSLDDWVFLRDETERQEYVMNEQGVIFKGSGNYIVNMNWDYGQV